ncbi:hypothetical protein MPSD_02920 [Mycobacterium pseudoshottsii JCM 15466]|uniref:Uncharacterized protein n=1 Tax=Mycobacterium pseudoshottsii TaxID=265949 RepID=A0A9N7QKQ8_9MYCO|nr:hypothetical protein MPSD_02920 [Mycobacterium pseudoshottsii JCM 15466]BDN80075.1 hypothetical protein NJB1907Z4_C02900 [Mycobacterium pseudoshottsii]
MFGDVDIEPGSAGQRPVTVIERIRQHHDDVYDATRIDNAKPIAAWLSITTHLVYQFSDDRFVIGMFVRNQQIGGRPDPTRLIAVHPSQLI